MQNSLKLFFSGLLWSLVSLSLAACLGGKEDTPVVNASASGTLTIVTYDATNATLLAQGRINIAGSLPTSVVQFHKRQDCSDPVLVQGTSEVLSTSGVSFQIPTGQSASLFVSAAGFAPCVLFGQYTPNTTAPAAPRFTSSSPSSPSRVSSTPYIFGSTTGIVNQVNLFSDAGCTNLISTGTPAQFASTGLYTALTPNAETSIYAQAVEPLGTTSPCTLLTTYTHTTSGPAAPGFVSMSPLSPSRISSAPTIKGTVAANTVRIALFSDANCSVPAAEGTSADFTGTGIQIQLPVNHASGIYAIAYDAEGGPSVCQYLITYIHDSVPPQAPVFAAANPPSPTNATTLPMITGSASLDTAAIKFYRGVTCLTTIGSATRTQFETSGASANVVQNSTTDIYASSFDAAGNESACVLLTAYRNNTIPPEPPSFDSTIPVSPNNSSTTPKITGFVQPGTVHLRFFSDEACTAGIGSGPVADFTHEGITLTVSPNQTTTIYAQAVDAETNRSECTAMTSYGHSNLPAPAPGYIRSFPHSPSNQSYRPSILGTAASTIDTVSIYGDSACVVQVGRGTRLQYIASGIDTTLDQNKVNTLYAVALDVYGNVSSCVHLTDYIHNTIAPTAPLYTDISPASPNNSSITPQVTGTTINNPISVLPVSTVSLYDNLLCLNRIGTGTPAQFASTGLRADVAPNTVNSIYARTFDAAGNTSACTFMVDYTHDDLKPGVPFFSSALPESPSFTSETKIVGDTRVSTDFLPVRDVVLYSDNLCQSQLITGSPEQFKTAGFLVNAQKNASTNIYGVSFNVVGTSSSCVPIYDFAHSDVPPQNLSANLNLDGSIALSWSPDLTAFPTPRYILKRSIKSGGPYTIINPGIAGTSFIDRTVSNGVSYYYVVSASNNTGESLNSTEAGVNVSISTPQGANSLTAIPSKDSVSLAWSGFATNSTYKIYRSTQAGGPYTLLRSNFLSRSFVDLNLINGTAYYYVVVGVNPSGDSAHSNEASAVPLDVPDASTNLILTALLSTPDCGGGSGVQLVWNAPSHYSGFFVRRGTSSGGLGTLGSTTEPSYTDCNPSFNGGVNNTNYYAVAASWGDETSPLSNEVAFSNVSAPSLRVYPGDNSISVSWSNVQSALSYTLYKATKSGGPYTIVSSGTTATTYNDASVTNGSAYFYKLQTHYASGSVGWPSLESSGIPGTNPTAPSNLIAQIDSTKTPSLSWTAPANFNYFKIYRASNSGGPFDFTGTSNVNSYLDSGAPSDQSFYRVTAVWGGFETGTTNVAGVVHGYPITMSASATATTINLSWATVSNATGYTIFRSTTPGSGYAALINVTAPPYSDTTVAAGTGYFYVVKANFPSGGSGENSPEASAMLTGSSIPRGLAVIETTSATVGLAWAQVTGATSYKVYRSSSAGGVYTFAGNAATAVSYISGLAAGTTYHFKVTAMTGPTTESAQSASVSATTLEAPQAPVVTPGNNLVDLQWSPIVTATSYSILRSTDGSSFSTLASGLTATTYADSTAVNNTLYFYKIESVAGAVHLASPASVGVTPGIVPSVPAAPVVTGNSTGDSLVLAWARVPSASRYRVYMSTSLAGSYTFQYATGAINGNTVTGLTAGIPYYFKISAMIGSIESGLSNAAVGIPAATPPAPSVTVQNNNAIRVAWAGVSGAATYDVERSRDKTTWTIVSTNAAATTFTDSSLTSGEGYYYRYLPRTAAAIDLAVSSASDFITFGIVPTAPTTLSLNTSTSTNVSLRWVQSPNSVLYRVYRGTTLGVYNFISNVTSPTTTFTDSGVSAGTTYYYVVTAVNQYGGESVQSNAIQATTGAAPTALAATPVNGANNLSWGASAGSVSYNIRRSLVAGGPYGLIASGVATTSFSDSSISNGLTYYYIVNGVTSGGGASPNSNEASAVGIVRMNLQVPIELTDQGLTSDLTAHTFERTRTSLDTDAYDGTSVTYEFEVVASNSDTVGRVITLVDSANVIVASTAVPASTHSLTRRRVAFTPAPGANTYRVGLPATTSSNLLQVASARLLVTQVGASKTRLYIPLLASANGAFAGDVTSPTESTTSTERRSLDAASFYRRDTTALSQLADTNAWQLETLVASVGNARGLVSLYNKTRSLPVLGTQAEFTESDVTMIQSPFAEGSENFGPSNESDLYELSLTCQLHCASGAVSVYKAGLWVNLVSLSKVEVHYRTSLGQMANFEVTSVLERSLYNAASFSNPVVSFEATGSAPSQSNEMMELVSLGTTDAGDASPLPVANSSLNFMSMEKTYARTGALTLTSGHRYVPRLSPAHSLWLRSSNLVIRASR